VFAPTAAFLGDVESFLADWLVDVELERRATPERSVPVVVPNVMKYLDTGFPEPGATAVWGDAAVWVPWALWQAYGNERTLREAYPLMTAHTRSVAAALAPDAVWDTGFQFGDWLDPDAPADDPGKSKAPAEVVATASAFRTATMVAEAAEILGESADAAEFAALRDRIGEGFRARYVRDGRVESDSATAYALAIAFGLLDDADRRRAGDRLAELVRAADHRISTGFAGTPFVCDALTTTGHLDDAYALLLQREAPSWLYAVTMGATTIWERWDSMLPDGSINPGEMTSFNHYAFGAVADWMHRTVGGLAPLEPGYRRILIAPQPGGGITWAETGLQTPYGRAAVRWDLGDAGMRVEVTVPAGAEAVLRLPGRKEEVLGAGTHVRASSEGVMA
jgi:alpha-L-rhamnosidase